MLAAVYFHIQRLRKTDAVELSADLSALIQPLRQRLALNRHVHHLHVMQLERLLEQQGQRRAGEFGG